MRWRKLPETFPLRIFLVALILRLVLVLVMHNMGIGLDDMFQYDMLARSIVAGNGYRWYAQEDLPLIQPVSNLDLTRVKYDPHGVLNLLPILDDGQRDLIGREKALKYIRADPGRFPFLIVRRAGYFFGLELRALTYFFSNNFFGYISFPILLTVAAIVCLPFVILCISGVYGSVMTGRHKTAALFALLIPNGNQTYFFY